MKCHNCSTEHNQNADGAAKVTVALVIADEREPERCTAVLDLCPKCYKETELDDWLMDFQTVEQIEIDK